MKSKPLDSFTDYIVNDQLGNLHVTPRKMFGGVGLYADGVFFGIISQDQLYFKTNDNSCKRYIQAGMGPFQPNAKQTLKSYYQVPDDVVEHSGELTIWAWQAIECAKNRRDGY